MSQNQTSPSHCIRTKETIRLSLFCIMPYVYNTFKKLQIVRKTQLYIIIGGGRELVKAAHMLESKSTISGANMSFCFLNLHSEQPLYINLKIFCFTFSFFILHLFLTVTKGTVNKARTNSAWVSSILTM